MYFEFVPFRDFPSCEFQSLKRNQVLELAPTEVLFTPRAVVPSLPLARLYSQQKPFFLSCLSKNVSAPLCSCSGTSKLQTHPVNVARATASVGHKKTREP